MRACVRACVREESPRRSDEVEQQNKKEEGRRKEEGRKEGGGRSKKVKFQVSCCCKIRSAHPLFRSFHGFRLSPHSQCERQARRRHGPWLLAISFTCIILLLITHSFIHSLTHSLILCSRNSLHCNTLRCSGLSLPSRFIYSCCGSAGYGVAV